jgi:hypothetical protein
MKKLISLILIFIAAASSRVFADNSSNGVSPCQAEISIRLKEPTKEIKTNAPVLVIVQIKNLSTNETLMYQTQSLPTDFAWTITSPSGRDLSPVASFPVFGSGWNPKLSALQSRETDYDLSSVYSFSETGVYKVTAKKQVAFLLKNPKRCDLISNPLSIVVTK